MCKRYEKIVFLSLFVKIMLRYDTVNLKANFKINRSYIRYAKD